MKKQATKAKEKVKTLPTITDNHFFKEEYLRWVFVIIATIVTYSAVAWLVYMKYTPDIEALKAEAAKITFLPCDPEPMESLLYQLALVFIPVSILFFYWVSKKKKMSSFFQNFKFVSFTGILCSLGIVFLMYHAFAAPNPNHTTDAYANLHDLVAVTNWDFYFYELFLHHHFLVYLLLVFPLFLTLFWQLHTRFAAYDKHIQRVFSVATWCILGLLLLVIVPMNSFEFPYTMENKYDFNAVYYSTTQVYSGAPMLVNGLSNTYGLYAQLLNPVFQITGLTPRSFSTVMAILLGLCFIFQTYFVHKFTNNKFLVLLACSSLVFFPYLASRLLTPFFDPYFAIFPIRWLSCCTLLMIAAFYISHPTKIWYFAGNILLSLLVLWNPEIGMVSFLSWLALLVYVNFYTLEGKIAYAKIAKLLAISLSVLIAAFVIYAVTIKLFYGVFPDFISMFKMMTVFGSLGFNMLPMSVPHPWMLFAIIYITSFVYALTKLSDKTITPKSSAVFLLSILGSGLFMYFVGRSHNWTLLPFLGPCFMLLAILGDDLWTAVKTSRMFSYRILFAIVVFVLAIASVEMLVDAKNIKELTNDSQAKMQQIEEEKSIKSNQQFISANTSPREKIFVFTKTAYQGLFFPPNKNRSAVNPGFIDLVLNTERDAYIKAIRDSSFKIFIEPQLFREGNHFMPIAASFAATYELEKQNGSMFLLKKRTNRTAYGEVLENKNNRAIVHEIFTDDTIGFRKRENYAKGYPEIQLEGNTVTAEVVFIPTPQVYQYAVLLSNQDNDTGFSIFCIDQQANYGVNVADQAIPFEVKLNQVNHLTVSIQEQIVTIFLDGNFVGNYSIDKPYKPSDTRLHIGNYNNSFNYYIGDIQEVLVY